MIIIDRQKLYNLEKYSLSGNRTPVSSVTDWDTYHYTNRNRIFLHNRECETTTYMLEGLKLPNNDNN